MGQGTALGVGMGLTGKSAWAAQRGGMQDQENAGDPRHPDWSDWEFYFPGVYDAQDTKILKEFQAQLAIINNNNRDINIDDLIRGKLEGKPGIGEPKKITAEDMKMIADRYVGNNSLFTDRNYARKTKYGDLIAFPMIKTSGAMPAMPKSDGFGDYMVITSHNDTTSYYKPFYEGDTLYTVIDDQHCIDITPEEGSYYRTFNMSGRCRIYNQKGELVAEGANILKESFRRHKDLAKRNPDGAHAWESPDWWLHPVHIYTDEDWEYIISIWKNEKVRGADPLYWDDVEIGDEPTPIATGPGVTLEGAALRGNPPQWSYDIRKNVLDPKTFSKMVKNKQGVYVLPEYLKPAETIEKSGFPGEIANRDWRATYENSVVPKMTTRMIYNWMGDQGWLQRIGWDMMEIPPGSAKSISYDDYPTMIPPIPKENRPALFDKYPYMDKVPYMRGCRAAWHGLQNDLVISRGYITDKYKKDNEYFVDLTWWAETIDRYLIEEGFATVKLPKK
jgi:acyl dehydratase